MRSWLAPLAVLSLLAGCAKPQPSDYLGGAAGRGVEGVSLGPERQRRDLQPAAGRRAGHRRGVLRHMAAAGGAHPCGWRRPATATPMSIAASGPWRDTIDLRFTCDAPVATSILGDAQAA